MKESVKKELQANRMCAAIAVNRSEILRANRRHPRPSSFSLRPVADLDVCGFEMESIMMSRSRLGTLVVVALGFLGSLARAAEDPKNLPPGRSEQTAAPPD